MRYTYLVLAVATGLFSSGCFGNQFAADGRNFRQALLDMYTDQTFDNLIRAAQNQPYVQLAYHDLVVTDNQFVKANLSEEYDPSNSRSVAQATGAFLGSMNAFTHKILFG